MRRGELFWLGPAGMMSILASAWIVGALSLALLVFDRAQAEPWVRAVMPTLLSMLATRAFYHPHFGYTPFDYFGLEAAVGLAC